MEVSGQVDTRFGPVRECFAEVIRGQAGTGAAFAAFCDGRLVADLWGGWADRERTRPWEEGSLVQPYSVSKPFVAVCALRLVEAGRLNLDAPVQRYWPEFRAQATVRHILSHQAGELVRRVDGRGPGRFLRDEVCGPAGLDFAFGLSPSEQARTADLTGLDAAWRAAGVAGRPALYQRAIANPPGAQDGEVVNSAAWRAAEIPAVNGHATARAVAGFYQALATGGLLSAGMLAEAVTPQCAGPDLVFGEKNAWGLGFGIDDDSYGMGGLGGNYGGFCPGGGYSVGFVTGSVGSFDRVDALENALRSCIGLPPLPA
jgi:CubicO group peptidase (beta-lactamase class C family)